MVPPTPNDVLGFCDTQHSRVGLKLELESVIFKQSPTMVFYLSFSSRTYDDLVSFFFEQKIDDMIRAIKVGNGKAQFGFLKSEHHQSCR